jgi:hypothetical protein
MSPSPLLSCALHRRLAAAEEAGRQAGSRPDASACRLPPAAAIQRLLRQRVLLHHLALQLQSAWAGQPRCVQRLHAHRSLRCCCPLLSLPAAPHRRLRLLDSASHSGHHTVGQAATETVMAAVPPLPASECLCPAAAGVLAAAACCALLSLRRLLPCQHELHHVRVSSSSSSRVRPALLPH